MLRNPEREKPSQHGWASAFCPGSQCTALDPVHWLGSLFPVHWLFTTVVACIHSRNFLCAGFSIKYSAKIASPISKT